MHLVQRTALVICTWSLPWLAACHDSSNGGGSTTTPPQEQSFLTLAVTDAPSTQIASFRVQVRNFRLERSDGTGIDLLKAPAEVDLAALTDLRQVLNVRSVPPDVYTAAEVLLDFSSAVCVLHGQAAPAALRDREGQPLDGTLTLHIDLNQGAVEAVAEKHAVLELDVDLDQSLVVDAALNTVEVEPVLVLREEGASPKQLLVVGEIVSVDTTASTFRLQAHSMTGTELGPIEFDALPFALYHVDGEQALGASGLEALQQKGAGTWVQILGAIDPKALRLAATHVAAGHGTYAGGADIVEGYVLARSSGAGTSPTLSVRGHSTDPAHASFQYNQTFSVDTNLAATKVLRWGSAGGLDLDDVNVGQLVCVYGALSGTHLDATQPEDVIRLEPTRLSGFAHASPSGGVLSMDVDRIGPLASEEFSWGGGGATPPDPFALELHVQGLGGGLAITLCSAIEARGQFTALHDDGVDFTASALENVDEGPALMFVRNHAGQGLALSATAAPTSIQLSATGTAVPGEAALVHKGFLGSIKLPESPTPTLQPPASGSTYYLLTDKVMGETVVYTEFAAFSDALAQALAGGAELSQIAAIGPYDWPTNTVVTALASACVE